MELHFDLDQRGEIWEVFWYGNTRGQGDEQTVLHRFVGDGAEKKALKLCHLLEHAYTLGTIGA